MQKEVGILHIRKHTKHLHNITYEVNSMTKQAKTLNSEELRRVLDYVATRKHSTRNRALVVASFFSGCRVGELSTISYSCVVDENGKVKNKMVYKDEDKKEFMNLVFGRWEYFADTKSLTKATFSLDIPSKAIKILSYKNDIVVDPFMGSGTSAVAAEVLDRRWIGIELSPDYCEVARNRIKHFKEEQKRIELEIK